MATPNIPEMISPNRRNLAGTSDGHHPWTRLELEHAIVLRQYKGLVFAEIAVLLNAHFSTAKTTKTVSNKLQIESGTLSRSEAIRRPGGLQPLPSILWEQIEEVGTDSLEVGFVLFSHGLMTQEDWDERKSIHHLAWQQQQGSATMLETANQIWRIRGGAASQAGPSAPNDTNPYL